MVTVPQPLEQARAVTPTPDELKAQAYDTDNIEAALEALHQDGFVVLKSIVDVDHLDKISAHMTVEADELIRTDGKPFNQGVRCMLVTLKRSF